MNLSNMKHETKQKVLLVCISVQFPFLFLLILVLLPVSLSPSRLFLHLLLSPFSPPSSPPLFSISPSYHTCSLFQSWAASKLVCAVCVCVTSRTLHTHTNTHINASVHSCTYALTRIYTHQEYFTRAHTHTHTHTHSVSMVSELVSVHPEEVASVQSSPFTPSHLCLARSTAQFNMAQHDMAHYSSAPHAICQLNTITFR